MDPVEGAGAPAEAPLQTGWMRSSNGLPMPVHYRDVGGWAVAEGCMLLGRTNDVRIAAQRAATMPQLLRDGPDGPHTLGSGIVGLRYRWPFDKDVDGYLIPYTIAGGLDDARKKMALDAMAHWTARTKLRFRPLKAEKAYVEFIDGPVCSSFVGKQGDEKQELLLAKDCTIGNIIHEIGHLIGLWHEHNRADRDQHVTVALTNVDPPFIPNFLRNVNDGATLGPYDYGSIMHYPSVAFAIDPAKPTIIAPTGVGPIGQRTALSAGDIAAAAALYP